MNILLCGASGQLGQELLPLLTRHGGVIQVDQLVTEGDRVTVQQDLGDLNRLELLLNRTRPDIVVNAAAYTAVDAAQDHRDTAFLLNADMPGCLARWCARNDRLLLHYSTDYVFSGDSTRPWQEQDPPGPLNVYGESKLGGERAIAASGCRNIVLRTSWVYSGHGNNFVLTMLRLARQRPGLKIVADQVGCPTWARNLARVSSTVLDRVLETNEPDTYGGLYHYCDGGVVSWFDFAQAIFRTAKRLGLLEEMPEVEAVRSSDFQQKARRPLYSVLDTSAIQQRFGIERAGLNESLLACLEELVNDPR